MGINTTIFDGINNNLSDYGLEFGQVKEFLIGPHKDFSTRQNKAIEIVEQVLIDHGKEELLRYVVQLAKVEYGIHELEPGIRDHVVHAVLSYFLGIYIYEHMLKKNGFSANGLQWKLAGLLHDVGYPAEIAKDILKPYTDQINEVKRALGDTRPNVVFRFIPDGIHLLSHNRNSLQMFQNWIDRWGLRINVQQEYEEMINSGNVRHGIISSLSVLYVIDLLYQKYNPARKYENLLNFLGVNSNQTYFDNEAVPACAAIFVHNLPARCFQEARIDRKLAPLPFLLCLSDSLQDWDRPSGKNQGIPDTMFEIEFVKEKLIFRVRNSEQKVKVAREIASTLVAEDVEVC
jgi:hypothetical protein